MGQATRLLALLAITTLTVSVVVLSIFLVIFVQKYYSVYPEPQLAGIDMEINSTWDGQPISHKNIKFSIRWNDRNKAINIKYKAPFYGNPAPPNHTAGVVPGLWSYEVMEFFFLNSKNQYIEVELGPMNHYLVYLLNGTRQSFNTGENLQLSVWNTLGNKTWDGEVDIPLAYLPPNVTRFNAYNIHVENGTKIYEALFPAIGNYSKPDFHRTELFGAFDDKKVIPDPYFSYTSTYKDPKYPDLWKGFY